MNLKKYLSVKSRQLKHACWFAVGFSLGCSSFIITVIALALAVLLDILSYWMEKTA